MGHALWPLFLLVTSNWLYHTCSKCSSAKADPFAILTLVYLVATIGSFILFLTVSHGNGGISGNIRAFNWANYLLGLSIIGLEGGFLYLYRTGWNVSVGPVCAYCGSMIGLLFIGALFFHDHITCRQVIGTLLAASGVALISFT